jgi:hypothetical protein
MARAPKRLAPEYVSFQHEGETYVLDLANREVLQNWVSINRQRLPEIMAAYKRFSEPVAV